MALHHVRQPVNLSPSRPAHTSTPSSPARGSAPHMPARRPRPCTARARSPRGAGLSPPRHEDRCRRRLRRPPPRRHCLPRGCGTAS
eukprot:200494-Chlamydomonas_euryale.AAC.2